MEWGRGSHLVLEGGRDGWEKGWDGLVCFGMVLGEGVMAAWEREKAVSLESGTMGDSPRNHLPPPEHPLPVLEKAERAPSEGGTRVTGGSKC